MPSDTMPDTLADPDIPEWSSGPWHLGADATGEALTVWGAKPGICITSVFDDRLGDDTPPMWEAKANARLISAAPDLYEQLDAMLQWHNEGRVPDAAAIDKAEAALAKARGDV